MTKGYFITGTDTGVGKTLVAAVLTSILKGAYWKPIESGVAAGEERTDPEWVRFISGLGPEHFFPTTYSLKAPLSPDQAAALENRRLDLAACVLPSSDKTLIVEGAGGIYVPINEEHNMMDLMKQLNLPVIIVARGTLGTINHTLMTIESLRQRQIPIHGVVFNGPLNPANQTAIEKWGKISTLFQVPHFDKIEGPIIQRWIYDYTLSA